MTVNFWGVPIPISSKSRKEEQHQQISAPPPNNATNNTTTTKHHHQIAAATPLSDSFSLIERVEISQNSAFKKLVYELKGYKNSSDKETLYLDRATWTLPYNKAPKIKKKPIKVLQSRTRLCSQENQMQLTYIKKNESKYDFIWI